jgi:ATP-binding cassette subfamily B protein
MVLEDLSFSIEPGESVAFVGPNGSGKTTLIKLICRFYDPVDGAITLGGTDLRQIRASELRKQFSYMFQDFVRYQMTAHNNVWLGDHTELVDLEHIRAAATKSGADQIVAQFPDGYQSVLGHQFIGGQELSGGQWQRFALARFFVSDAPILILDEPISGIDAVAEEHILKALQAHANGRTVITISHRLSAIRHADRIFVMDQGHIVESGPHDELVRGGGLYAKMFHAQARNYQKTDDAVP